MKKTPLKKGTSTLKKTPLRKVSKAQVEKNVFKRERTKDIHSVMFEYWNEVPHICMACDRYLGEEFSTAYVDHLLEKSIYPQFAKDKRNFFMVCLEDHAFKGNGFPKPKHKEAIEKAKKILLGDNK